MMCFVTNSMMFWHPFVVEAVAQRRIASSMTIGRSPFRYYWMSTSYVYNDIKKHLFVLLQSSITVTCDMACCHVMSDICRRFMMLFLTRTFFFSGRTFVQDKKNILQKLFHFIYSCFNPVRVCRSSMYNWESRWSHAKHIRTLHEGRALFHPWSETGSHPAQDTRMMRIPVACMRI